MHLRGIVQSAVFLTLISFGRTGYSQTGTDDPGFRSVDRADAFSPVFDIMTIQQADDSPGCRGCHIGPDAFAPWGQFPCDTQDECLAQFEQERPDLLAGGISSSLGELIHTGVMPRNGVPWTQDQLDLLDAWLIAYP